MDIILTEGWYNCPEWTAAEACRRSGPAAECTATRGVSASFSGHGGLQNKFCGHKMRPRWPEGRFKSTLVIISSSDLPELLGWFKGREPCEAYGSDSAATQSI